MNCRQCHNSIPDQALFCPFCGQACNPQQPMGGMPPQQSPQSQPPMGSVPPPQQPSMGVGQPPGQRPPGRRCPKWVFILIGAFSVLVVAGVLLLVLRPGSKQSKASAAKSGSRQSGVVQGKDQDSGINPELKTGAVRFSGQSSDYTGIESLELKFVLSEDRSNIHDVAIQVTNLQGEVRNGSVKISTKVSRATEHFTKFYPIEFDRETQNIRLGESRIRRLHFKNGKAYALLAYKYKSSGNGAAGGDFKISFGEAEIVLTPDQDIETDGRKTQKSTRATASSTAKKMTSTAEKTTSTAKRTTSTSTAKKRQTTAASSPTDSTAARQGEEKSRTNFNPDLLKNWDDAAMEEAFGVGSVFDFKPEHPLPMHYIVVCRDGVYDPVTKAESEGGRKAETVRHKPISTADLIRTSGHLKGGGLTLTDDPNEAAYALILDFSYIKNIGEIIFNDSSSVPQYHATLNATLRNLKTGESIDAEMRRSFATDANERVRTSMLEAAKGKQLYGGAPPLSASDFDGYWDFVED